MVSNVMEFDIDWADCDVAGIVFYPQFFRMMNRATCKLFAAVGLPIQMMIEEFGGVGIPLVDVDLPLKFHPVAIRASAVDTPFGAG